MSLSRYAPVDLFQSSANPGDNETDEILSELEDYNLVIFDFQNTNIFSWDNYGISDRSIDLFQKIVAEKKVILNLPASPYAINEIPETDNIIAFLVSYQDDLMMQDIAAQAIFGGVAISGSLPIELSEENGYSTGIQTKRTRLQYSTPESLGIDCQKLVSVDSIVRDAISKEIFPGCAVIAAKDGIVFYKKTFGHHTYENDKEVEESDLYDLASLTKILATTPAVMKLSFERKIDVDHKLSWYLPYLNGSNKEDLVIREIMAHQAKLRPWIPYYQYTLDENGNYIDGIYNSEISEEYPVRVAEDLFISKDYAYVIYDSIRISELRDTLEYKYSDLGFYLLVPALESLTNKPVQDYVFDTFYKPLGLTTMGYLPLERFPLERIIPTEDDKIFRKQLLQGDVHDQGAALLGGVSGHAGLFSNANDVAILMQMLLQYGQYGGEQFLDSTVVYTFTSTQFPLNDNRRGIGFDKPQLVYDEEGPTCRSASSESFGHSGFTGTYAWADPDKNLVYVFLSNRIYPDASNNKIMEHDIRTRIHQVFYDGLTK
jgi:CubicO group peptidase (beta-lactamase class C family)